MKKKEEYDLIQVEMLWELVPKEGGVEKKGARAHVVFEYSPTQPNVKLH